MARALRNSILVLSLWSGGAALAAFERIPVTPWASAPQSATQHKPDWENRLDEFATLIGLTAKQYRRFGVADMRGQIQRSVMAAKAPDADARKRRLIAILDAENKMVAKEPRLSEAYVNYYGDVIAAVATLQDRRSLMMMIDAITTGDMAISTLVSFGPDAVEPVAARLANASPVVRSSVTLTLSEMLVRSPTIRKDSHSRGVIKDVLIMAADDTDPIVRRKAVVGLVRLGDADSVALVRKLAATDPYQDPIREDRYIVREAAAEALKTIAPANRNP